LSEFRLAKLLASLKKLDPGIRSVAAEFRHFVECRSEPGGAERAVLERLLRYGFEAPPARGSLYLVVPRPGTVSPWSSKATDIARNCGLQQVRRVERGVAYYVEGAGADIAPLLHDRMTEAVLRSFDRARTLSERGE